MAKGKRRAFTKEFKAQTVRLVRGSGKSLGVIARELDLGESTPSRVRTSAEPRPERPARPLAMQFAESFDQRSPQVGTSNEN